MSRKNEAQTQLRELQERLEAAAAKLSLAQVATDIVHGEGAVPAHIMLIGEAPGYNEAVQRRPFAGRSGQLLRKTLSEVGYPPESVFISNIVKVRPPDNRDPTPEEIAEFRPFLDEEIQLVAPQLIVTLGRFSMAKFLPDVRISQVHGRLHKVGWHEQSIFVLPMYHPAAALRGTQMLQAFQADFAKLPKIMAWIADQQRAEQVKSEVKAALF